MTIKVLLTETFATRGLANMYEAGLASAPARNGAEATAVQKT